MVDGVVDEYQALAQAGGKILGRAIKEVITVNGVRVALDGVTLSVPLGSLSALVGPDGAGKTTLLRLAAGLLKPDAGRLSVLGIDVVRDPQSVQDRISYMPQRVGL